MRKLIILLALLLTGCSVRGVAYDRAPSANVTHAVWDDDANRFICPANTSLWADEAEALAGRDDYAYCVLEHMRIANKRIEELNEPK
jgi:hypothetical protein